MTNLDDIPEALRERVGKKRKAAREPLFPLFRLGVIIFGLTVFGVLGVIFLFPPKEETVTQPQTTPSVTESPQPVENVLGHLPYQEVAPSELQAVTPDGRVRLHKAAAQKFKQMQADARLSGVILTPLSGFRSVKEQEYLFFGMKAQRNQETRKRAEVSAPPGYSEHHTGYAVDIGDGKAPSTNVNPSFENTVAFKWLKNNAAKYSFELSFPPNNPQGISYEPWHWRYVGDSKSLETFYKAQQLRNNN